MRKDVEQKCVDEEKIGNALILLCDGTELVEIKTVFAQKWLTQGSPESWQDGLSETKKFK